MSSVLPGNTETPVRAGLRERLDTACQRAIVGMVVFVIVVGPLAIGGTSVPAFLALAGMTALALALWGVRMWIQRPFRLFWPPICWPVLAFLVYAIIRCQLVDIPYVARQELIRVVVYTSLFFVIINNLNRRESANMVALALIGLGLVLSFFAIFQFATKYPFIWGIARPEQYFGRGSGTYINPNHLAGFLGMIVPLALAFMLLSRFSPTIKVLFGYSALVMLVGIVVTLSRGGIAAASAMLVVFCAVLLCQRGFWLAAIGIAVVLVVLGTIFSSQFGSLQDRAGHTFYQGKLDDPRTFYWPAAVQLYKHHVLWGAGPGHFDSEYGLYRSPRVQNRPVYAHNDYLNTLAEWGLTGFVLILATLGFLYYGAIKTWVSMRRATDDPSSKRSDKAAFVLGASLGLTTILFHSVVDFNMQIPANAIIAVTLIALISAHWRFATERFWRNPKYLGRILLNGVILAGIVYLAVQGERQARGFYWMKRADHEIQSPTAVIASINKAYQAEPDNFKTTYSFGNYYRALSEQGDSNYEAQALEAMKWYSKTMTLNPYDPYVPIYYGMCLDWIGRTNESTPYFERAARLDTNNYYLAIYEGRHYVALGDYATAKRWYGRSLDLSWNQLAAADWGIADERMKEAVAVKK